MIVKTLPVGQLEANCYLAADEETKAAMLIDPGDEPDRVLEIAGGFDVQYIVLTHGHFDHAGAVKELKEATGAVVAIHEAERGTYRSMAEQGFLWGFELDSLPPPDVLLKEGDEISLGGLAFMVLHTPGHSPGGICLYGEGTVFTGDTLFAGSVGRTDLPGGGIARLGESFRRLMSLPDSTVVLPGHGPATTIGRERLHNMFSAQFLA